MGSIRATIALLLTFPLLAAIGCHSIAQPPSPSLASPSSPSHPPTLPPSPRPPLPTSPPLPLSPSPPPTLSSKPRPMPPSLRFSVLDFGYTPLHEGFQPQAKALVFQDQKSWTAFWQTSRRLDANLQKPAAPPVDFTTQAIIGITSGSRSTGGYGLKVERVELKKGKGGDRWVIHYNESTPGEGCMVTQATTTPVVFISLKKPALPVELQGKQTSSACR